MRRFARFGFIPVFIRCILYVLFVCHVTGCNIPVSEHESKSVMDYEQHGAMIVSGTDTAEKIVAKDSLTIEEYMHWLYSRPGMTYAETENQALKLSLLYKPQALETAMAGEASSEQESKNGYLYFELSWLDKIVSVNKASGDKERLAAGIRESLLAETGSGVVYNTIVEIFPPVLLNQPGKMLVLVPASSFREWIELRFRGEKMGLEDAVLRLTSDDINSLPKLKL